MFQFYQTYSGISASSTSALGGSTLTVTGSGFDSNKQSEYRCFFILQSDFSVNTTVQDGKTVPVSVDSPTTVTCVIPEWEGYEFETYFYLVFRSDVVWKQGAPEPPLELTFYPEWSTFAPSFIDRLGGLNGGRSPAITVSGEGMPLVWSPAVVTFIHLC